MGAAGQCPGVGCPGRGVFSRTTNGGPTWSKARAIYQSPLGMETSANQIVDLPDGDLLDVFNELGLGAGFPEWAPAGYTVRGCADRAASVGAWHRRRRGMTSSPSGTSSGSATRRH